MVRFALLLSGLATVFAAWGAAWWLAAHAARAVEMMFARYRALRASSSYVCLFKNHGRAAGASIPGFGSAALM